MKDFGNKTDFTQGSDPDKEYDNEFETYKRDDWEQYSAGVSDPSMPNGTNRQDLHSDINRRSRTPKEIFDSIGSFKAFPDSFLIINDLYFPNVPLSSINYESPGDVFVGETLRSPAPVVESEGRQDFILHLSLPFPPGDSQAIQLKRLMAELTQHPLIYIYNNDIKKKLGVPEDETTMFILESGSLRSTMETVGLVILDLQLHYYNYKPFSKHFYFNATLPGFSKQQDETQVSTSIVNQIDLDQLSGYESSDYAISKIAEATTSNINREIINLYAAKKQNVPVNFPASSDAWMYFANHLESKVSPVTGISSDAVGFRLREYKIFLPPDSKFTDSPATLSDLINKPYKKVHPAYSPEQWQKALGKNASKDTRRDPKTQTVQEQETQELTKTLGKAQPVKFTNVKTGFRKTISIVLLDDNGNVSTDAISALTKLADIRKLTRHKDVFLSSQLIRLFAQIANHYKGRTIEFVSGLRDPGWVKQRLSKDPNPGKIRRHVTGEAMDMRVKGIPNKIFFRWAKDHLHNSGKGFYPNSSFVHIDARNSDAIWIDESGKGEKSKYVKGNQTQLHRAFSINYAAGLDEIEDDIDAQEAEISIKGPRGQQQAEIAAETKGSAGELTEKQRRLKEAGSDPEKLAKLQQETHVSKNNQEKRQEWIEKVEIEEGVHYYYDDPKLRNVFYRDIEVNISSNRELQDTGKALRNIVCTGVSITFGHRISPMRLLSQRHYTYQFLGAGNKTGQLVFTFAGEEGKRSANIIAELFQKARQNASDFTSIIRSVGSVQLINTFFGNDEQNTILALSGINNIVIANISDSNTQDGADTYQLIIEFIAQEFAEEKLEEKFQNNSGDNRKIIKSIMKRITSRYLKYTNENIINTDPNLVRINANNNGDAYQLVKDTPLWVGELIVDVARKCRELDESMPPVAWQISEQSAKTWNDVYRDWGASHVFKGRIKNINTKERSIYTNQANPSIYESQQAKTQRIRDEEKNNHFEHNGALKTNATHAQVLKKWLSQMAIVVRQLKSHMHDEEVMEKYFPGLVKDAIDAASGTLTKSSCYLDMHLPNVPGTKVPLPPEFYIYDDSHEDPLVSNMTDEQNMEKFLEKHVETEQVSIEHYIDKSFLGGSYLSKNLPRILEQRASEHKRSEGENKAARYMNYFVNGATTWEPLYTRRDNVDPELTGSQSWISKVSKYYNKEDGGGNEKFQYLDSITQLSGYIRENRQWDRKFDKEDNERLIKGMYGDAENVLAFGPKPEFESVDSALSGKILDPKKQKFLDNVKNRDAATLQDANSQTKTSSVNGVTTNDKAVTFGSTDEEIEANKPTLMTDLGEAVEVITGAKQGGWVNNLIASNFGFIVTNPYIASLATGVSVIDKVVDDVETFLTDNEVEKHAHFLAEKAKEANAERKQIAQTAAKTALAKKRNDLSMRRAYPTFKIYFIEDDSGESEVVGGQFLRAFDDFYSYSAIQEIKIHMDREIAADMATIRMTNVGGHLLRKRFGEVDNIGDRRGYDGEKQGIFADTEKEHPFEKMILQDGMKVQIRLGYCADEKTEILTQRGWLKYNELNINDSILTLNHSTGNSEWSSVDKINIFNVKDEPMVKLSNRFHSSLTTQQHKWPILYKRQKNKKKYYSREFTTSKELRTFSNTALITGAQCTSMPNKKYFTDEFVELMAWFWTEGQITNTKNKNRNPCIVISQSHTRNKKNCNRIRSALLGLFGLSVNVLSRGNPWGQITEPKWAERKRNNKTETNFRLNTIASKEFAKWAPNKIVSNEFILKLTKQQLELFIDVSNMGDGNKSYSTKKPYCIGQKIPEALNALEFASILAGYKVHKYKKKKITYDRNGNPYYMSYLTISDKIHMYGDSLSKTSKNYTGVIWCPTTKNKTWCAKRNGTVFYTGNSSNPNHLKSLFLGQIVEVSLAEGGKIIEIAIQGYGAELEAVELGPLEDGTIFYSSQSVLSGAIIQDSIANFGRQDRFNLSNPASARHSWTGGKGFGAFAGLNPANIVSSWAQRGLESTFNRYDFLNYPQDDNIYAPSPEVYSSTWGKFWNNACIYRPLKQTAWEIFKEHELRHPGYISMAVPYGHEPRMTMFFGSKMQHYWSRSPSSFEVALSRGAKNEIIKLRSEAISASSNVLEEGLLKKLKQFANTSPQLGAAFFNDVLMASTRYDTGFALGELFGRYVPFRGYHYFDSHHHILKNEIRTSVDGTFNEVEIYYTDSEGDITDPDADDIIDYAESMYSGSAPLLAVKLDENIPESAIRCYRGEYPSCVTKDMAKRYAQGIFGTTLRNAYKGELCIIGDENIKPYDVCFLNDTSVNMTGPIEVQAVTHIFNRDFGYVSIITPDLCLEVNDYYTATVFDVASSAMDMTWGNPTNHIPVYGALKGLGYLALLAGVKFAMWSQEGAPVLATPLTLGGKPFLSNSLGPNQTSLYLSLFGKWQQYWDDTGDAWRRFDLSEAVFESRLNFQKDFYHFLGADSATGGLEEA